MTLVASGIGAEAAGLQSRQGLLEYQGVLASVSVNSDHTGFVIRTSANGGTTWTTRVTVTTPVALNDSVQISLAQFSNGDIGLAYNLQRANETETNYTTIRFVRIVWGTWTVGSWEVIADHTNAASIGAGAFDIDISDGNSVGCASLVWSSAAGMLIMIHHRKPAGGWTQVGFRQLFTSNFTRFKNFESVTILAMTLESGVRNWIAAASCAYTNQDHGILRFHWRITESTSAPASGQPTSTNFPNITDTGGGRIGIQPGAPKDSVNKMKEVRLFRRGTSSVLMFAYRQINEGVWYVGFEVGTIASSNYATLRRERVALPSTHYNLMTNQFSFSINDSQTYYFRYGLMSYNGSIERVAKSIMWTDATRTLAFHRAIPVTSSDSTMKVTRLHHGLRKNPSGSLLEWTYNEMHDEAGIVSAQHVENESVPTLNGGSPILELAPSNNSFGNIGTPNLMARARLGKLYSPSTYYVEFQLSRASNFSSPLAEAVPIESAILISNTEAENARVMFARAYRGVNPLGNGQWFYRARLVEVGGIRGAWTATQTFYVGHPPSASPIAPLTGFNPIQYDSVDPFYAHMLVSWKFFDPSPTDSQSAYQLRVWNDEDGTDILFTPKVMSSDTSVSVDFEAGLHKDKRLGWQVFVWDSEGEPSDFSGSPIVEGVYLTDLPSGSITAPAAGATVATGRPTVSFTYQCGGSQSNGTLRNLQSYNVVIMKGSEVVWNKQFRPATPAPSGAQSVQVDANVLKNNTQYSVQIFLQDAEGLSGATAARTFTTGWVPATLPSDVRVSESKYNVDNKGYMEVTWADTGRESGFSHWRVYRKVEMLDINQVPIGGGTWEQVYSEYGIGGGYVYRDFFAPASHFVTYAVMQVITRDGMEVESLMAEAAPVIPRSDGYWLIEPSADGFTADAFKLSIVTGDSFSDEQEEAEVLVIGRGRVVNKGERIGYKGTLDIQLRNTGGTTARQKRMRLEEMKSRVRILYLRNPFGDIFKVNVSDMSINRISGTGTDEFCDVSMPYSEVH